MITGRYLSALAIAFVVACAAWAQGAAARPRVLVDLATGRVLASEDASAPWKPASITKLMTAEVAFRAVREGLLTMSSPVRISERAASAPPSASGLPAGFEIALEDALRIMLTKSANDLAVAVAEAVAGSEEGFAAIMNREAARLGMRGSRFVNASGLDAPGQVTTAEDVALLARSVRLDFPEFAHLLSNAQVNYGGRTYRNTNGLVGRYPGADGMKTGYICASGFNLVATAARSGRGVLAVVLGERSTAARERAAAELLDLGFRRKPDADDELLRSSSFAPGHPTNLRRHGCGRTWNGEIEGRVAVIPVPRPKPSRWAYVGSLREYGH